MLETILKTGTGQGYWDDLTLIISGKVPQVIRITDRNEALELDRVLTIAGYHNTQENVTVTIHQSQYTWDYEKWNEVHNIIHQWSSDYMIAEFHYLESLDHNNASSM